MTGKLVSFDINKEALSAPDFGGRCRRLAMVFRQAKTIWDNGDWPDHTGAAFSAIAEHMDQITDEADRLGAAGLNNPAFKTLDDLFDEWIAKTGPNPKTGLTHREEWEIKYDVPEDQKHWIRQKSPQ